MTQKQSNIFMFKRHPDWYFQILVILSNQFCSPYYIFHNNSFSTYKKKSHTPKSTDGYWAKYGSTFTHRNVTELIFNNSIVGCITTLNLTAKFTSLYYNQNTFCMIYLKSQQFILKITETLCQFPLRITKIQSQFDMKSWDFFSIVL